MNESFAHRSVLESHSCYESCNVIILWQKVIRSCKKAAAFLTPRKKTTESPVIIPNSPENVSYVVLCTWQETLKIVRLFS